jgi:Flp pilus assembly protein TadD
MGRRASVAERAQPREPGARRMLDAGEPVVHNNLGVLLMAEGRLDEAEHELREELAVNPGYPQALQNLTAVLRARGQNEPTARAAAAGASAPP